MSETTQKTKSKQEINLNKVFGFNDMWIQRFIDLNQKLSIWIADSFLEDLIEESKTNENLKFLTLSLQDDKPTQETKIKLVQILNENEFHLWKTEYFEKYRYILDWILSPRRGRNIDVVQMTFKEALQGSKEWHESLEDQSFFNYDEKNEILIDFRDSEGFGYYWANLNTDYSEEESSRMGHCGRDSGTILFSLRSTNNIGESKTHITVSYNASSKKLEQIKGRRNSKPKEVYYPYLIALLQNKKYPIEGLKRGVYGYDNNFKLEDLTDEQRSTLFKENRLLHADFIFGDKETVATSISGGNKILLKDTSINPNKFGIADLDTLEIIVPFEYVNDTDSSYSEFILFEEGVKFIITMHLKNESKSTEYFVAIDSEEHKFNFINKKLCKELIPLDQDFNKSWQMVVNHC